MISSSPKVQTTTENSFSFECIESHGVTTEDFLFYFLDYFIKTCRLLASFINYVRHMYLHKGQLKKQKTDT